MAITNVNPPIFDNETFYVDLASTANISSLSGNLTIDGITTTSGVTRVLVKNQSTPAQNGVYLANSSTWTRLSSADTISEVLKKQVFVTGGFTNRGKLFYSSYNDSTALGTDPIRYQEVPYDRSRKEFWEAMAIASAGGGYLCHDGGDNVYMLRLTNPGQLKKYSISTNTWSDLTGPGVTMASCSKIVYGLDSGGEDSIFVGNSAGVLYKYLVADDVWSTLATATTAFVTLEWDGNDQLFAARGSGTTTWYKYVISTNTWSTVTAIPAGLGVGGDTAWDGSDFIYLQLGNASVGFYRYSISGDSWIQLSSQPNAIGTSGASLCYLSGYLYCFRGNTTTEQFRYDPKAENWLTLTTPTDEFGIDTLGAGSDSVAVPTKGFIFVTRSTSATPFYRKTVPIFDANFTTQDVGINTNDPQTQLDINGYFRWLGHKRSTVDLTKTSNTTLSDHTQLRVWLNASKSYTFKVVVFSTSNVAGGVKVAMGGLLGLAGGITYEVLITDAGATTQGRGAALGGSVGVTAVTAAKIVIEGLITTTASGLLTFQYAQNASTGSASTFLARSHMEVKEVA